MGKAIERGINLFKRKMDKPQYKDYLDNDKAQMRLLIDCIRQEMVSSTINSFFDEVSV